MILVWWMCVLCCFFFCWYLNLPKSMIRQTGGFSLGATSTRSSPASRARFSASSVGMMPNWPPSAEITRIGVIRICSLMRCCFSMAHDSGRGLDAAGREECLLFKSGNGDTPRGLFQESQHTGPLLVHDLRRYTEYSSEWVRASRRGVFVAGTPAEHWYSLSSPESGSTETRKATVKCHPHAIKPSFSDRY